MKKRFLSIILCLTMVIALLPTMAFAALPDITGVTLTGDVLSWNAVPGATRYSVNVGTGGGFVSGTSVNLREQALSYGLKTGTQKVTIVAYDKHPSDGGQEITRRYETTYSHTALGVLDTPQNARWNGTLIARWDAVPNADYYVVYLYRYSSSGTVPVRKYVSVPGDRTTLDFTKYYEGDQSGALKGAVPGEQYKFEIAAHSRNGYSVSETGNSEWTQFKSGAIGNIQNIKIVGETMSWNAYPGAACYQILFDNSGITVTGTTVNIREEMDRFGLTEGTKTVKITAYDTAEGGAQNISKTATVSYDYTSRGILAAPTNLQWNDFAISWDPVAHASSYVVTLKRSSGWEQLYIVSGTSIDFSTKFSEPVQGETYSFNIYAVSDTGYSKSAKVEGPSKTFPYIYNITVADDIENGTVSIDQSRVAEGDFITVDAKPAKNYMLGKIFVDGSPIIGNSFIMPGRDIEVGATFIHMTAIDSVACNLVVPMEGNTPETAVTYDTTANYTVTVESCDLTSDWSPATVFEANKNYQYSILFDAKPGYYFTEDAAITVNGENNIRVNRDDTQIVIRPAYTALAMPLTGTVSISGDVRFSETVTANATGNYSGVVTYTWYVDGEMIASKQDENDLYISQTDYIGRELTVTVTDNNHSGQLVSAPVTISKMAAPAAPVGLTAIQPSAAGLSDGSINGTSSSMEYAADSAFTDAHDCVYPAVNGLAAGTYYVRYKETAEQEASSYTIVTLLDGDNIIKAANCTFAKPIEGVPYSTPIADDPSMYTVTLMDAHNYYDNFVSYSLHFEPVEGYRFADDAIFTANGDEINVQNRNSNWADGIIRYDIIKLPLSGTLTLSGTGECYTSIATNLSGENSSRYSNITWHWYRDGVEFNSYNYDYSKTIYEDDVGHEFYVICTASDRPGQIKSNTVVGIKAPNEALGETRMQSKPSQAGAADGSIFCYSLYWSSVEISTDKVRWNTVESGSETINGLAAGTYYLRKPETGSYEAGPITTVVIPEADMLITTAVCTVTPPAEGAYPDTDPFCYPTVPYTVSFSSCDRSGPFTANQSVRYKITFTAKEGYKFDANTTVFKINGEIATTVSIGEKKLTVQSAYFRAASLPITGTATLVGSPTYGSTVAVDVTDSNAGFKTYTWMLNEEKLFDSSTNNVEIRSGWIGGDLYAIVTDSNRPGKLVTETVTIGKKIPEAAPGGLKGIHPTTKGGADGQITGTDTTMEYDTTPSFASAKTCYPHATSPLPIGTYYVRYKETAYAEASPYATVVITDKPDGYTVTGGHGAHGDGDHEPGVAAHSNVDAWRTGATTVTITDKADSSISQTTTTTQHEVADNASHEDYSFAEIPEGEYVITVEKDHFVTREIEVEVNADIDISTIDLYHYGDANQDGDINVMDMQRIYEHLNNSNPMADTRYGDANEDTETNVMDMQRIYEHLNNSNPLD